MKTTTQILLAALAVSAATAHAVQPFTLTFDARPSGSAANLFAPIGLDIRFGVFAPRPDGDGIDIPGSEYWQTDTGTVLAENPATYNYGAAPSPTNALNAKDQAVLLLFDTPFYVTQFYAVLDNSTQGNLGPQTVAFYDAADTLLYSTSIDETVPGFTINTSGTPISGVSKIVLPNNAFYDNITVVPEPGAFASLTGGAGLLLALRRRRLA